MPRTSRALLAVQAVLVALHMIASVSTLGELLPRGWFAAFVLLVGAAQAAVAAWQYYQTTMTRGTLVVLAVLAALQVIGSSGDALADILPGAALPVVVMVVAAVQAGIACYVRSVTTSYWDPPPYEPGRLAAGGRLELDDRPSPRYVPPLRE